MELNWDAVGAIGEIIGALAVLLTLIYLAMQIRQNTRSIDETRKVELARNRTQLVQLRIDRWLAESASNEVLEMYVRLRESGFPDPQSLEILSPVEFARLSRLQRANLLINMNAKYQYEQGLLDEAAYDTSERVLEMMTPVWTELGLESLLSGEPSDDA